MISLSEFQRLDLRVGQIFNATSEQLVGSQVIVAANVEPATIRGVTSQGMLSGANCHANREIALLTVNRQVPNRTRVE